MGKKQHRSVYCPNRLSSCEAVASDLSEDKLWWKASLTSRRYSIGSLKHSGCGGRPEAKLSNLPQSSPAGSAAEIATQKLNFWVTTTNSAPVTCTYIHSYIETYIETREVMIIYID